MNKIKNIVIIDDNKIDCYINKRIINTANNNIKIKVFNNAIDALDYIKKNVCEYNISIFNSNLIFLDINMPNMNGFEFLNELASTKDIKKTSFKVYFLSSSANESDVFYAKENEFSSGYIVKPLTKDKLNKALMSNKETFKIITA